MITITDVHKIFNKGKANQVKAVNGVTLEIKSGEFLVVVGSNGSGKTTMLNLIAGSVLPDTGTISIDDTDVTKLPDYKRSQWIARVFQNPLSGTAPDLSILDNFRLASLRTKAKGLSVGVNDAFKKQVQEKVASLGMGLQDKIDQPMGTLSGGQRQALTLLMSVMDSCKVLLLDEPTAALDPRSAEVVMRTADTLISEFELTAVFITHNLKDAFNYGTRIIQMGEGLIINDLSGKDKAALKQNDLFDWFA
ncbi:ATP-binding cassette domain-containing protein [Mucilaginibacter sp. SMC90]|uniref:ABC transporter ATP-binding protein n=1 Tax=Mucilaginibacter sp. SMC90 TaxID=2929803 RepID=UPI001FB3CA2B|nr:ATP-binding cassette domain-containing protein [Mucilaginibacter sp. SMC90]UOE51973.1 ATP-binding cassette domain-containing protein [Mucilaginibacter sp. SMC90]